MHFSAISHILHFCSIVLLSMHAFTLNAQDFWTFGTAKTLAKGQFETGIVHPLKYGAGYRWELQIHPIAALQIPNLGTKIHWFTSKRGYLVGTRHTLYYPTPALRRLAVYDINLSTNDSTPAAPILVFRNELLISKMLLPKTSCTSANYLTTLKFGVHLPLLSDSLFAPVEIPVLFPRTHVYNDTAHWYVGLDSKIMMGSGFYLSPQISFHAVDWRLRHIGIEHHLLVIWQYNENWWFMGGYKFSWQNSFAQPRYALFPVVDILWRFRDLRKDKQRNLFHKKMF